MKPHLPPPSYLTNIKKPEFNYSCSYELIDDLTHKTIGEFPNLALLQKEAKNRNLKPENCSVYRVRFDKFKIPEKTLLPLEDYSHIDIKYRFCPILRECVEYYEWVWLRLDFSSFIS